MNVTPANAAPRPANASWAASAESDAAPVDSQAVENARREIQGLAREIADLAKSDIEPEAFYEGLLSRVVLALGAVGGAVWLLDDEDGLKLACQSNFHAAGIVGELATLQHSQLLHAILGGSQESLFPPHTSSGDDPAAANPTGYLLVLGPLAGELGIRGVLEIVQRPGTSATSQRGYARFVRQMCELAADYAKERRLRAFDEKQVLWDQLEEFTQGVHASLDSQRVAFTLANEGRRLIACDRVSVTLCRGRTCRAVAISGQDDFERRSNLVSRLEALASAVAKTGEPMWYLGDKGPLAPQVERALDAYLDLSHAKLVAVLPLLVPDDEAAHDAQPKEQTKAKQRSQRRVLGVFVVEQLTDSEPSSGMERRVETVAKHGAAALHNALQYQNLFLLPVWRTLGRLSFVVRARTLPKTILVVGLLAAAIATLVLVPADFTLEARGTLQPTLRREVFAGIDGVVIDVPVHHGQKIQPGDKLAEMRNTDLEVQITDVLGRREATSKQLRAVERSLLGENKLSVEEQNRLSGQLLQLKKTYESLDRQLALYHQKEKQLIILSEIPGQVVTWQVRDLLMRRPVRQGQSLMSVADPAGPWELEIHMPEDRMGHIATAQARAGRAAPLGVEYVLATEPGTRRSGRVSEIHSTAEVRGEEGNTVLIRVAIDKNELADLRPGATVTAKIDCGRRALGYVWLHDLIGFVQRKILFRLQAAIAWKNSTELLVDRANPPSCADPLAARSGFLCVRTFPKTARAW